MTTSVAQAAAKPVAPPRMQGRSLRTDWLLLFIATALQVGGQWFMSILIARFVSTEALGHYTLALALTTPLFMLFNLSLRTVVASDVTFSSSFTDYASLRVTTSAIALAATAAIGLVFGYNGLLMSTIILVGLTKMTDGIGEICYAHYQRLGRVERVPHSLLTRVPLGLCAIVFTLWSTRSVVYALGAGVLVHLVVLAGRDLLFISKLTSPATSSGRLIFPERIAKIRDIAKMSLPLGLVWMMNALATNAPRYFLADTAGPVVLGIAGGIMNLTLVVSFACLALGEVAVPRWAAYRLNGQLAEFRSLLLKLTGTGTALSLVGVVVVYTLGDKLLPFVYGASFAGYHNEFIVSMWGLVLCNAGTFLSCALYACGSYTRSLPVYAATTAATFTVSWVLVTRFSLMGAAVSLCFIGFFSCLAAIIGLIRLGIFERTPPRANVTAAC